MRALSTGLLGCGISSFRFDFAGNGSSEGSLEEQTYSRMLSQIRTVAEHLRAQGLGPLGICGHSLGASLSILYAATDPDIASVGFLAGSSEASRVRTIFPPEIVAEAESKGQVQTRIYGRDLTLTRKFILDTESQNIGHASAVLNRPLLVVHGSADEVIAPYHGRQVFAWAREPKTFLSIDGSDHQFRNPDHMGQLVSGVKSFFGRTLARP